MKKYKVADNTLPSGFSIHSLSEEDISKGGEKYLPFGFLEISEEESENIRLGNIKNVVPYAVTMRQARLALLQAGKLQAVNNAIAVMQGSQGDAARIEWDYSNEVRRDQPLTLALAQAIGMTEEEMDALFINAAKL